MDIKVSTLTDEELESLVKKAISEMVVRELPVREIVDKGIARGQQRQMAGFILEVVEREWQKKAQNGSSEHKSAKGD